MNQLCCVAPPAPALLHRIVAGQERLRSAAPATAALDAALSRAVPGGVEPLDLATLAVLLGRSPATRAHATPGPPRPVTGDRRALVLLADFADRPASTGQTHFVDLLFSVATHPTGSLRDYYREASYRKLDLDGLVSGNAGQTRGWYRAPEPKAFYAGAGFGFGGYPNNSQRLVEHLISEAAPYVDFSDYDANGDGVVDALIIVAAGSGAEVTGRRDDFWSHTWALPEPIRLDGVTVSQYSLVPEDSKIGVLAHEMGHALLGWPDLYDTDYSSAGTGNWDLMSYGTWNAGGERPAHPGGYCKLKAGWIAPATVANGSRRIELAPYATHAAAYRQPIAASDDEYFLLTNRQPIGFDANLPGGGLVIEHVDEGRPGNADENHYLVDVEQCDGRRDLNLRLNLGDAADTFPAPGRDAFTADTKPNSRGYTGDESGLSVTAVKRTGASVSALVTVGGAERMSSILGSWELTVDWGNDGVSLPAGRLAFHSDGSWAYRGGGGRWVQVDGGVLWTFDGVPGLVYSGSVTSGSVAGVMGYAAPPPNPGSGSFYLLRAPVRSTPAQPSTVAPAAVAVPVSDLSRGQVGNGRAAGELADLVTSPPG
jgi:immune inhibitor A